MRTSHRNLLTPTPNLCAPETGSFSHELIAPLPNPEHQGVPITFGVKQRSKGFTLLEVLVALVIVATALGASLRAVGSLTQNSGDLRASMMANWSAENRLSQIRLAHEWPELGQRNFDCPQGELQLKCEESVFATPNPFFRRVEVSVFDTKNTGDQQPAGRRILKLVQVVTNAQ
jgi:general secretion pathway protein I